MKRITPDDVDAAVLRESDAQEAIIVGMHPIFALRDSVAKSWEAFVVCVDGKPLAYWGHAPSNMIVGTGRAWMVSTPEIEEHKLFAAAASRIVVTSLMTHYVSVFVQVDPAYELAVKWLSWLGFMHVADEPPFILMQRKR